MNMHIKRSNKKIVIVTCFFCFALLVALMVRILPENALLAADIEDGTKGESAIFAEENEADAAKTLEAVIARIADGDTKGLDRATVKNVDVISEAFGQDAWGNVTYEEVEAPMILVRDAYVICETGEEISVVEYERMLDEHVRAICAKRGYDHALVEKTGSEICVMSQEDITKYHEVNEEIVRTCPVKLVAMPDGESKRFVLKFAGRSSAGEAGICDITVDLVKIDDKWQLHAVLYSDPILPGDDV